MEHNPYEAPRTLADESQVPKPAGTGPQPWEVGEVLSLALAVFRANAVILVVSTVIATIIPQLPGIIIRLTLGSAALDLRSPEYHWGAYWLAVLSQLLFQVFLGAGLWRISLVAVRGGKPEFGMLFSGSDVFVSLVIVGVLRWLAVAVGLVLLIVPGIILVLGLQFASLFVVDQKIGPLDALTQSWEVTTGHKGNLFILMLAFLGIVLLGMAACCFGIFVALPIINLAIAIVYLRLSGTSAPMDELRALDPWRVDAPATDSGDVR